MKSVEQSDSSSVSLKGRAFYCYTSSEVYFWKQYSYITIEYNELELIFKPVCGTKNQVSANMDNHKCYICDNELSIKYKVNDTPLSADGGADLIIFDKVGDPLAIALGFFRINVYIVTFWMLIGKSIRFIVWGYLTYWGMVSIA